MNKNDMINRILEISSLYDKKALSRLPKHDIVEIFEDITDDYDMFPNGRDFDAEDEEF